MEQKKHLLNLMRDKIEIEKQLRLILEKEDIDVDNILNRKVSDKHESKIELLMQHLRILIQDLKHDAQSSKNEMFAMRDILEDGGELEY